MSVIWDWYRSQAEFDSVEYPRLGASDRDIAINKRNKQARTTMRDEAKKEYDDAKSKFKSADCFKK
jgi:hypothetical protein